MFTKYQTLKSLLGNLSYIPAMAQQLDALTSAQTGRPTNAAPYWPDIEAVLRFHVTPGDTVFDIGANQGVFTALFGSVAAQVYAFEPNPEMAAALRSRSFPGNVTIHEVAMSNQVGEATFHIDTRPGLGAVASSLMELEDLKAAGTTRPVTVRTTTVDDFVATGPIPTFIKIDVEGHEPAVLEGARRTIEIHRPTIIFEMWENHWNRFADTFKWLSQTHYLVRVADGTDALAFYSNNSAEGGVDILALPLARRGRP